MKFNFIPHVLCITDTLLTRNTLKIITHKHFVFKSWLFSLHLPLSPLTLPVYCSIIPNLCFPCNFTSSLRQIYDVSVLIRLRPEHSDTFIPRESFLCPPSFTRYSSWVHSCHYKYEPHDAPHRSCIHTSKANLVHRIKPGMFDCEVCGVLCLLVRMVIEYVSHLLQNSLQNCVCCKMSKRLRWSCRYFLHQWHHLFLIVLHIYHSSASKFDFFFVFPFQRKRVSTGETDVSFSRSYARV